MSIIIYGYIHSSALVCCLHMDISMDIFMDIFMDIHIHGKPDS